MNMSFWGGPLRTAPLELSLVRRASLLRDDRRRVDALDRIGVDVLVVQAGAGVVHPDLEDHAEHQGLRRVLRRAVGDLEVAPDDERILRPEHADSHPGVAVAVRELHRLRRLARLLQLLRRATELRGRDVRPAVGVAAAEVPAEPSDQQVRRRVAAGPPDGQPEVGRLAVADVVVQLHRGGEAILLDAVELGRDLVRELRLVAVVGEGHRGRYESDDDREGDRQCHLAHYCSFHGGRVVKELP